MVDIEDIKVIAVYANIQGIELLPPETPDSNGDIFMMFGCEVHYITIEEFIELLYLEEEIPLLVRLNNKFVPASKYDSTYIFHEDAVSVKPAYITLVDATQ